MTQETGPRASGYRVHLVYTEPEFHRRHPELPAEYSCTFGGVRASNPDEAARKVEAHFHDMARRSRVAWARHIKSLRVLGPSDAPAGSSGDEPF